MSQASELQDKIYASMTGKMGGLSSTRIHDKFKSEAAPIYISNALRHLCEDRRLKREVVKGEKGFVYSVVGVANKFNKTKRTWQYTAGSKKPALQSAIVESPEPFRVHLLADGDASAWKPASFKTGQADASGAFTAWWAAHGPFRDAYWKGLPKTVEVEQYMDSFKAPAYTAWIAGIKYAKTGNWAASWEELENTCHNLSPKPQPPLDSISSPS